MVRRRGFDLRSMVFLLVGASVVLSVLYLIANPYIRILAPSFRMDFAKMKQEMMGWRSGVVKDVTISRNGQRVTVCVDYQQWWNLPQNEQRRMIESARRMSEMLLAGHGVNTRRLWVFVSNVNSVGFTRVESGPKWTVIDYPNGVTEKWRTPQ